MALPTTAPARADAESRADDTHRPAPAPEARTPTLLAKAALRRLALQRLEPTPANFARAWREEGGPADPPEPLPAAARQGLVQIAAAMAPAGNPRSELQTALVEAYARQQWEALRTWLGRHPPGPGREARGWAELIDRLMRQLERGSRQWTVGRKKDSLQRVLESSRSDVDRLYQRLNQLAASWDEATTDAPSERGVAAAATDFAALAVLPAATSEEPTTEPDRQAPPGAALCPGVADAIDTDGAAPVRDAEDDPHAEGEGEGEGEGEVDASGSTAARPPSLVPALDLLDASLRAALPPDDARARPVAGRLEAATRGVAGVAAEGWQAAFDELDAACQELNRVLAHRHHFVDQLCRLADELTDSLGEFAEDDSWVQGQVAVMRHTLRGRSTWQDEAGAADPTVATATNDPDVARPPATAPDAAGRPDVRAVRSVVDLLHSTRIRHKALKAERAQARDALRELIRRMLQELGELGTHTGRFSHSMGRYAQVIGQASTLESLAGVVREMVDETQTVHQLVSATTHRLEEEHRMAGALAERVRTLEEEIRRLSDEVSTDPLTQVANRRGLLRHFERELAAMDRAVAESALADELVPAQGVLPAPLAAGAQAASAIPLTGLAVALLDIDNFKKLNDSLGHAAGDEALKFLSRRVGELLRPSDTLARFGGEEFVVLLPATGLGEAQQVLTRLQRLLSAELFMHEGRQTFVTFSAGVTLHRPGETLEACLQRADEALYEAKRTGKNRTCLG